MEYNKKINMVVAAVMIVLGLLCFILEGQIIKYALTALGILVIALGIVDLVHRQTTVGVIKIIVGAVLILLGWLIVVVMLYIVAVLMIAYGVYELIRIFRQRPQFTFHVVLYCMKPVLMLLAGIFLMFNQGGAVAWAFKVTGVLLMVDGIVLLLTCMPE